MKQKVKVIDTIHNKVLEKEVNVPNKMHLDAQIRYPSKVFKNKMKYTRKQKHKNNERGEY